MKVGDVVMFVCEGVYEKWFFGQLGIIKSYTPVGADGNPHCRVEWMNPVPYHDSFSKVSDFRADKFEVAYAGR